MVRSQATLDSRSSPGHDTAECVWPARTQRKKKGRARRPSPLGNDAVDGFVFATELHAVLGDELGEQGVERLDQGAVAMDLEGAFGFDLADARFLDVAGHERGEQAPQIDGALVDGTVEVQVERGDAFMGDVERLLEAGRDVQIPIEVEGLGRCPCDGGARPRSRASWRGRPRRDCR